MSGQLDPAPLGTGVRPLELGARQLQEIARARARPETPVLEVEAAARFVRQQEWLGRVEEIGETSFTATLLDLSGHTTEEEEAELSVQLVRDQDEPLLKPGALFYWVIGYYISPTVRRGESQILFKRALPWTDSELQAAAAEGDELWEKLEANGGG